MTTYGTIPTSSSPTAPGGGKVSPPAFFSRAKELGRSALATRRPWRELLPGLRAFGLPPSLGESYIRIRTSLSYFALNYAIIVLLIVFLALLYHPVSLIVFVAAMAAWLVLYFLRDEPIVLFGRVIGDKAVLIALSVVTLALLLLTHATVNILVSLLIGLAVVLAHAAVRKTEDLCLEEEAGAVGPAGGWYSAVEGGSKPSSSTSSRF